jgi:hypothetical protein
MPGVSWDTAAALAVAVSDLKVVRLLRDAINSGLPKTGPLGTIPPGANPHTPRPRPKFGGSAQLNRNLQPRPTLRPQPRIEPRPTIHPQPRVVDPPPVCLPEPSCEDGSLKLRCPIRPVWETLPPVPVPSDYPAVKVFPQKVDVIHKGTLLDLFV